MTGSHIPIDRDSVGAANCCNISITLVDPETGRPILNERNGLVTTATI